MKSILTVLTLAFIMTSCVTNEIYWVNSKKTNCSGVGKRTCLLIKKGKVLNDDTNWQSFYSNIEGFEYEEGYLYKLKVKEEQLTDVPADASSIKYTLVKLLDKKFDNRFLLNDIWVAEKIEGFETKISKNAPSLIINIADNTVSGTDGCNSYRGNIIGIGDDKLEFGKLISTKKMCFDNSISPLFNKALGNTKAYKVENLKLYLYDENNTLLATFKKVD